MNCLGSPCVDRSAIYRLAGALIIFKPSIQHLRPAMRAILDGLRISRIASIFSLDDSASSIADWRKHKGVDMRLLRSTRVAT